MNRHFSTIRRPQDTYLTCQGWPQQWTRPTLGAGHCHSLGWYGANQNALRIRDPGTFGLHFSWCPWYCPYYRTERPWNAIPDMSQKVADSSWATKSTQYFCWEGLLHGSRKRRNRNDFGWDPWLVWRESSLCCSCRFSKWSPEHLSI